MCTVRIRAIATRHVASFVDERTHNGQASGRQLHQVDPGLVEGWGVSDGEGERALRCWRCHPDLNWGMVVLQTTALPLGYGTERTIG
jgi:hypothetical protein